MGRRAGVSSSREAMRNSRSHCSVLRGGRRSWLWRGQLARGRQRQSLDRSARWAMAMETWSAKILSLPGEPDGIRGLAEDDDGTLLIGMRGGMRRLVGGKPEPYPLPGNVPHFVTRRLLRDRDGGLWVGTSDRGLVHVHQRQTDVFSLPDGLTGDDVLALFQDREGNVWAATLNGLDRFRDFAVTTLSVKQGLSSAAVGSVL